MKTPNISSLNKLKLKQLSFIYNLHPILLILFKMIFSHNIADYMFSSSVACTFISSLYGLFYFQSFEKSLF